MRKSRETAKNPLRKLNKLQLLELLARQEKELQYLRTTLAERDAELERRALIMQEAGSIAEAALRLNHEFEAAQRAAEQYLESIKVSRSQEAASVHQPEETEGWS